MNNINPQITQNITIDSVEASIKKTKAGESIDRKGESIGLGKRTTRIVLDEKDNRFNIEARIDYHKSEASAPKESQYVPLRIKSPNKKILQVNVKVDDLANRLHLKPEKITEAVLEGKLEALVKAQKQKIQIISESVDQYKKSPSQSTLTSKKLMKVYGLAIENKNHTIIEMKSEKTGKKHSFVSFYDNKRTLNIHSIDPKSESELGNKGGFATFYKVTNLATQEQMGFKQAHLGQVYRQDLKNENEVLQELSHPGIMMAPHQAINLTEGGDSAAGIFVRLYENGSLDNNNKKALSIFNRLSPTEKLDKIYTLIDALKYMDDKKLMHGDIKPANILMDNEENIVFGDFGGARFLRSIDEDFLEIRGVLHIPHTPNYLTAKDRNSIDKAIDEFKDQTLIVFQKKAELDQAKNDVRVAASDLRKARTKKKKTEAKLNFDQANHQLKESESAYKKELATKNNIQDKYYTLRQKQDVYATGEAIYELLTGTKHISREQFDARGYPNPTQPFDRTKLEQDEWGKDLIDLIEKMLEPDADKRISSKEAESAMRKVNRFAFG